MTCRGSSTLLITLVLCVSAAAAVVARGQSADAPVPVSVSAATSDFRSLNGLIGRKVMSTSGQELASVCELIVDRGSGRIEYIVIKPDDTLNMGGRCTVVPYRLFRWASDGVARLVLSSTAEPLSQFPDYTPQSWKAMKRSARGEKNALCRRLAADASVNGDPYPDMLKNAHGARLSGTTMSVSRVRSNVFGEQIEITVSTPDGCTRRVALGPSWFINGTSSAPVRGDAVVIDVLELPGDDQSFVVGAQLRTPDGELHYLRARNPSPMWSLPTVDLAGFIYSTTYVRYLPVSRLLGARVTCGGQACGAVRDVVLDRTSGEIRLLSMDPDPHALDCSEQPRLLPWSVASVTLDGNIRIDGSKAMMLASPQTPGDLATLNSGMDAQRVYTAFNVPPVGLPPRGNAGAETGTAWSARGAILGAIDRDSRTTLAGTVVDVTELGLDGIDQPAKALTIRVSGVDDCRELVLLGPARYLSARHPGCKPGDSVKVDVCRTMVEGRRYWIARSIESKDTRMVLLDSNNAPAWTDP